MVQNKSAPELGSVVGNVWVGDDGATVGLKLFRLPYRELASMVLPNVTLVRGILCATVQVYDNTSIAYSLSLNDSPPLQVMDLNPAASGGALGLNVWQSSAIFNDIFISEA